MSLHRPSKSVLNAGRKVRGSIPPWAAKMEKFQKEDKSLGYMYIYSPAHPCANKSGKAYVHHVVVFEATGLTPKNYGHVHHIDGNKKNNSLENLMTVSASDHRRLHAIKPLNEVKCGNCQSYFKTKEDNRLFCSYDCARKSKRIFDVCKSELEKLVWSKPTIEVAKIFGVSDVAVAKRCKLLGIKKPSRGYWAKHKSRGLQV